MPLETMQEKEQNKKYRILLVIGIVLIAFNLRAAITSVGPVLGFIREDLGVDHSSVGVLTTMVLLTFAGVSAVAYRFGNRVGHQRALFLGLIVLVAGILIRTVPNLWFLYAGSVAVGAGIAVCNVLLPGVIKWSFPAKMGLMTSIYTTCMAISAAFASGLSAPIAEQSGTGWQGALLLWTLPALAGIILWAFILHGEKKKAPPVKEIDRTTLIWKSTLAWQVTLFMGFQSIGFYVMITWLPDILVETGGVALTSAGWMVAMMQAASLPASFVTPILAERFRHQVGIIITIGITALTGLSLLLAASTFSMLIAAVLCIGLVQGASISLALALFGLRAETAGKAAELSGMGQSIGYLLAAFGPLVVGVLYDWTGAWSAGLIFLMIIAICQMTAGIGAGRNKYV